MTLLRSGFLRIATDLHSPVRSRAVVAIIARGSGSLVQLVLVATLARVGGTQLVGGFYLYLAWVVLLGVVLSFGYPTLLLAELARSARTTGREGSSSVRVAILSSARLGSLVAVTLISQSDLVSRVMLGNDRRREVIVAIALGGVAYALLRIVVDSLKGLGRPHLALILEFVVPPSVVVLALIGACVSHSTVSLPYVLLVHVMTVFASFLIGFFALRVPRADSQIAVMRWPRVRGYWGAAILQSLLPYAPFLILPHVGSASEVGSFAIAQRIMATATVLLVSLGSVYSPAFSASFSLRDASGLRHAFRSSQKWSATAYSAVLLTVIVFRSDVLELFGGGVTTLRFLIIIGLGQMFNAATGLSADLLLMTGRQAMETAALSLAAVISVGLGLTLGLTAGATGVAFAFALALAARNVAEFCSVRVVLRHVALGTSQ
jgi:O-antigen/teichoic acid export membrane protein